jgi:multimeric flavodoxin WrbA
MKVIAINGSPLKNKGNTATILLNPFLEGLREEGTEVDLFYTSKLKLHDCCGRLNCWLKTPGECIYDDGMEMLYSKLNEADVWVLATPLYLWGMSGPLKNLLDRTLPLMEPYVDLRDGHCSHKPRAGKKRPKVVLISSCGFWELDNFDPLVLHIQKLCNVLGFEFAGALLRPNGPMMRGMLENGAPVGDVLESAKEAGRQLAATGAMSAETLENVSRPIVTLQEYVNHRNLHFQRELQKLEIKDGA